MTDSGQAQTELALLKELREHAWNWFSMHAQQRMQTLNFFLIAMAFLGSAYGTSIAKTPGVAGGVAVTGLVLSVIFNRLDHRNRELVKLGESALQTVEQRYQDLTSREEVQLVKRAERPQWRFLPRWQFLGTFHWSILFIEGTLAVAFLVAAIYAFGRALG